MLWRAVRLDLVVLDLVVLRRLPLGWAGLGWAGRLGGAAPRAALERSRLAEAEAEAA